MRTSCVNAVISGRHTMKRHLILSSMIASTVLLAGCGASEEAAAPAETATPSESTPAESETSAPMESETMAPVSGPVGPGCADYAAANPDGAGSVDGMAQDPVATAASNNPILTQLTAAVSGGLNPEVDLVDTLNGGDFTVFAPVDAAFEALPAETVTAVQGDADLLTTVLTYHVVAGQLTPEEVVGVHDTVQGGTIEITGTPEALMVGNEGAAAANVVCGGVSTSNAQVYLIDAVLMPAA